MRGTRKGSSSLSKIKFGNPTKTGKRRTSQPEEIKAAGRKAASSLKINKAEAGRGGLPAKAHFYG